MNNFKMELLLLIRSRSMLLLCLAYFIIGLCALFFGITQFYSEQNKIAELEARYQQDVSQWQQKVEAEGAGYAAYYLFNPVAFKPSPWSALFSGERKENLVLQRVRLLAVHGQIHGSPINNSEHSALGVLDIEFIWLYLLPLLIGLISVTCIADDRRLGRWPMVSVITSVKLLLIRRLAVRFTLVTLVNAVIILMACAFLSLKFDSNLLWVLATLIGYQVFWFLVSAIIMVFFLNARQSVLIFVATWMMSAWLIPAMHYNGSLDADTYNTGVELLVNQRQDMNDSWDRDKHADLEQFIKQYPQWQTTKPLGDAFDWKWYFAMQKRSDDKVSALAAQYLDNKNDTKSLLQWLSPTLMTQILFEDIANTGAADYQSWMSSVIAWHANTQNFWFPYFFLDKPFNKDDLAAIPKFDIKESDELNKSMVVYGVLVIFLCIALLFLFSRQNRQAHSIKATI